MNKDILRLQEFIGYLTLDTFYLGKALLLKTNTIPTNRRIKLLQLIVKIIGQKNCEWELLDWFDQDNRIYFLENKKLGICTETIKYNQSQINCIKTIIRHQSVKINHTYNGSKVIKPITKHIIYHSDLMGEFAQDSIFLPVIIDNVEIPEDFEGWVKEGAKKLVEQGDFT